ncbi:MAG: SWIM zinc finger family protein [Chloroflexi bacterium]|nr:SWIM zinc finger family protein [Chloroflexota bacterium]
MASKDNRNPVAREVKAITLANTGAVEIKAGFALVASGTKNGVTYRVTRDRCTCPDATYRGGRCCHQIAAAIVCARIRRQRCEQHVSGVA